MPLGVAEHLVCNSAEHQSKPTVEKTHSTPIDTAASNHTAAWVNSMRDP